MPSLAQSSLNYCENDTGGDEEKQYSELKEPPEPEQPKLSPQHEFLLSQLEALCPNDRTLESVIKQISEQTLFVALRKEGIDTKLKNMAERISILTQTTRDSLREYVHTEQYSS